MSLQNNFGKLSAISNKKHFSLLFVVFIIAILVRTLYLRHDSTIQRTDEAMFILSSLKLYGLFSTFALASFIKNVFWVFSFPWGYPILLFTFSFFKIYGWTNIPITEFTSIAPFAINGSISVVLIYFVSRKVTSSWIALAASFTIALLPSHIAQSRTLGNWILSSNLMMLSLLWFMNYLETRKSSHALLFSASLALYLPSEHPSPGILFLLFMAAFWDAKGSLAQRIQHICNLFWNKKFLFMPCVTIVPLVLVHAAFLYKGHASYGFIGHYLAGKSVFGFYGVELIRNCISNAGPAIFLVMIIGLFRGGLSLFNHTQDSIIFLWFLSYSIPTLFLIDPKSTVPEAYLTPILIPLVILGCTGMYEGIRSVSRNLSLVKMNATLATGFSLVFLSAAILILPRIYGKGALFIKSEPIGLWGGEIYSNNGAKTAGYWIRKNTSRGVVILSDLRRFVGKYYFNRPTIYPDHPLFNPEQFLASRNKIEVLAFTSEFVESDRHLEYVDGYKPAITVKRKGQDVFHIYTKRNIKPGTMGVEEFDGRFDREFGNIESLAYSFIWRNQL